jgi:glycosyltransferase involved in cell wall biosynthesis/peptidoglycan/xylan/chitin deacetylase (PgdA/CDA1 family)
VSALGQRTSSRPRYSVVIATYQRRELVLTALRALARQEYEKPFEVIVVVDGSTDGSAAAARAFDAPFPLTVLEHPNCGQSRSRNRGAEVASGELLLFLDDDMEADRRLLSELDRSHGEGADVAFGSLPLHPASPPTLLAVAVGRWADHVAEVLRKKSAPSADDVFTGQLSIRRPVFDAVGGFDARFTADGGYGNEDLDFGYRLAAGAYRIVFNPKAISRQYYATPAAVNMAQYRKMGHADVAFVRKHPSTTDHLFNVLRNETREHMKMRDRVLRHPRSASLVLRVLKPFVARRVDGLRTDARTEWWFFTLRTVEYWLGVHEAGGIPRPQSVRVLCYHAVADLSGDPVLASYAVPPALLRNQLRALKRAGYRFISAQEFVRMVRGEGGVPRKAVLLTFDDAYRDLLDEAAPILRDVRAPALTFAVTRCDTNTWDQAAGARALSLLDNADLARCRDMGIAVGAHSRTHRFLTKLDDAQLDEEVLGSVRDLETFGLGPVEAFAYPFGEQDERVRRAVGRAGLAVAFTTEPGAAKPGDDPLALRRIEVLRADAMLRFRLKVATCGRVSAWLRSSRTAAAMTAARGAGAPAVARATRRVFG